MKTDGGSSDRWNYTPERAWIEDQNGRLIDERIEPRKAFADHVLSTPWDDLHCLYFISYAMHNYLTTPWIFADPSFEVQEIESHQEAGEVWRVLQVIWPNSVPAHTQVQKFYFGEKDFMLRRLDYTTDVMPDGVAAHYCYDYKNFDGLIFPTTRRVVTRSSNGAVALSGPTAFWLHFLHFKIIDRDGKIHTDGQRAMRGQELSTRPKEPGREQAR